MMGMLAVLAVTALSGAVPASAATPALPAATSTSHNSLATASSTAGANWAYVDDDIEATNWSNQTQITAATAASLQVQWVVPFPNTDLTWKQAPGASWTTEPGSSAPPLIVNGIVYVVSDQGTVYAMNAQDGSILWSSAVTLNYTRALLPQSQGGAPIFETQIAAKASTGVSGCTSGIAADRNGSCLFATASPVMHRHGINDIGGVIMVTGFACELWGFNATTGATSFHIGNICSNVPGNPVGAYPATYTSDPPVIYQSAKGPMLLYSMGAYTNSGGRSFIVAYNYNNVLAQCKAAGALCSADNAGDFFNGACAAGQSTAATFTLQGTCVAPPATAGGIAQGPMWQVFENPPNGVGTGAVDDTNWDNEACSVGMVFDYPAWRANGSLGRTCSSLPASVKLNDWGSPKGADATVSTTWGQYVMNNKTGMFYLGTGEESPYPYYNPPVRPGLNLYGSSVMAINMTSGTLVWWYQLAPHDVSDWDTSWAPVLGDVNGVPAVFKSTKLGILFAFNQLTGKPFWAFENPSVVYGACVPSAAALAGQVSFPAGPYNGASVMTTWANGNPLTGKASMSTSYGKEGDVSCMSLGSPLNGNWLNHPYPTWPDVNGTYVALPAATGSLESDPSYFVSNGTPYIVGGWMNQPGTVTEMSAKTGSAGGVKAVNNPINVTVTALNANTGKIAWTHFYGNFLFRGSMAITQGMIVYPGGDGNVHFLNYTNGFEIATLHVGASLFVVPSLGLTSSGQVRMITIFGGGRWSAAGSLGGGAEVPGGVMAWGLPLTGTTGSTTTISVTGTVTATTTAPGSTQTVTSTSTAQGPTVTSTTTTTTGTTGINPTTFYVVAGIAVIAVIATGVLAVTRRKPSA